MSCTAQHDTSNVPIRPLLDYTVDFSTVEYMQLAKVVPKKSERLFDHLNRTKIYKETRTKQNDAILNRIARKGLGPTYLLSPSHCRYKRLFVAINSLTSQKIIITM